MFREGGLADDASAALLFWDGVFDDSTRSLRLERTGRVWDAITTAQRVTAGAGRTIAIIDAGFDLDIVDFEPLHPASVVRADTVEPSGRHGTVVAQLVRAAAPEATLMLIDVFGAQGPRPADVGAGIDLAVEHGAHIINLSLEYETDCEPRETDWLDLDVLTSPDPPVDAFLAQIDAWIGKAEPYSGSRCQWRCEICDALDTVPVESLIVAASGNRFDATCPGCFERVVGVGFHRTSTVEHYGVVFAVSGLPETSANVLRAELAVEEPPGFLGTSFAAPLLSGFAALLPQPAELAEVARLARALTPILSVASLQVTRPPDAVAEDTPLTLHQGLVRYSEAIPPTHRHWEQDQVTEPCPICALLFVDWYDVFTSLLLRTDKVEQALPIARIAGVLAPDVASAQANLGFACRRMAERVADGATRRDLLEKAVAHLRRAVDRAPTVHRYSETLAEALAAADRR